MMSMVKPRIAPINGAKNIKTIVLVQPERITTFTPPLATAAPRYPPSRACEELVGSQSSQVIIFHDIAQKRAQNMTSGVTNEISIIPLPIVFATAVPTRNIAEKLKNVWVIKVVK